MAQKKTKDIDFNVILYCFINDNGAVFLNRNDEVIKQFDNYNDCINYASKNINLINYECK